MEVRDFSKFSFVALKSPNTIGAVIIICLLGVLLGLGSDFFLEERLILNYWLFSGFVIIANLVSAAAVNMLAGKLKTKWGYTIVLINLAFFLLVTSMFLLSKHITLLDSLALWTVLSFTLWIFALTGLASMRVTPRSVMLAFMQPGLMLIAIAISLQLYISDLLTPLLFALLGITISTLLMLFNEHLFSKVFAGLSGFVELSKFLQGIRGEEASLEIGHDINPIVQYMAFDNGEKSVLVAPWLHSGPIRSVGGGNLSTESIELLNKEYGPSYFMHVPSNHEYNPSQKVAKDVVDLVDAKGFESLKVSKVLKFEEGKITLKAQKINDLNLLSFSSVLIDDYDIGIFAHLKQKYKDKKVLFVDSHPNAPMVKCINVEAFSKEADSLERLVERALLALSKETTRPAKAGASIRFSDKFSVFSLIIQTDGQTTLYFISDTNGYSLEEMEAIKETSKRLGIDKVLFFSTDTHSLDVKELINRRDIGGGVIEGCIRESLSKIKDAKFAFGEGRLENVRILGETYYELLTIVKILARVMPIMFIMIFVFLALLLWIF